MKVRKTMTEILLKVTNQLIEQTCKEERQRYIKKRRGIVALCLIIGNKRSVLDCVVVVVTKFIVKKCTKKIGKQPQIGIVVFIVEWCSEKSFCFLSINILFILQISI